jgi:hypothetical protein
MKYSRWSGQRTHSGDKPSKPSRASERKPLVRVGDHNDSPSVQVGDVYRHCVSCKKETPHRSGTCIYIFGHKS